MENIILSNSKRIFYEVGYFETNISNITKECGISRDKFYMYYESKEDLLVEVIKMDLELCRKEIETLVPKEGEASIKMKMFIRALLSVFKKNPFFFALLMELEEKKEKLPSSTEGWMKYFWKDIRTFIGELLKSEKNLDEYRRELLTSLVEGQLKTYIAHLLTENRDKSDPSKLLFLDLEREITRLSTLVINTCRSFYTLLSNSDPAPGEVYNNKEFFKLLEEIRSTGKPLYLIFLDLTDLSTAPNLQKNYFRNKIYTDIGSFLIKYFRETDIIGRLCPSKFMILVRHDNILPDTLNPRMDKLIKTLKTEYSLGSEENIAWKILHLNSFEGLPQKFIYLKPLQQKNSG